MWGLEGLMAAGRWGGGEGWDGDGYGGKPHGAGEAGGEKQLREAGTGGTKGKRSISF